MRTDGEVGGCAAHLVLRGLPSFARVSIGAALPLVAGGIEPPRTLCPIRQPCGLAVQVTGRVHDDEFTKQRCADLHHEGAVSAARSETRKRGGSLPYP